jgi:hypothetical protein
MDGEKEGQGTSVMGTIADAAKTSMDAAIEGVSSAATSIADAVTGGTEKPRRRRKTSKKAASRGRTTTRPGKAKRSAAGRSEAPRIQKSAPTSMLGVGTLDTPSRVAGREYRH